MGMRRHRRNELHNIAIGGDVNELAISGHVEHQPLLREDDDRGYVCEFVLTHTTTSPSGHWELERSTEAVVAKLSAHAIDVMILGGLERPADGSALLRAVRGGEYHRIHPCQPVITLGDDDELTVLRAYECGSDHHVADGTGYVLLRAVLASVARRALADVSSRHVHVGEIHIDLAARSVQVADTSVRLSRLEFELLVKFAGDPVRVFSKHELQRCIWRGEQINSRTVEGHVARLRNRLTQAGAGPVLVNKWGQGWSLTTTPQ